MDSDNSPISKKLSTLKHLPTLPHILIRLIRACNEEDVDIREISKIVEKDPSLTARILKLVNSSSYGLPQKIETIPHAVAYLGMNAIKNIAVSASVYQTFSPVKGDGIFNLKMFWWHSLRCALLARTLAKDMGLNNLEDAFLSGMLHDIGKLVLWVNFPDKYSELLDRHKGRPELLLAGEIRLGMTHSEVGAWLLSKWGFQSLTVDSVRYHHEPFETIQSALPLVQVVFSANILSHNFIGGKELGLEMVETLLGLNYETSMELISETDDELEEVARSLNIPVESPRIKEDQESPFISKKDRKTQESLIKEVRDMSLMFGTIQGIVEAPDSREILRAAFHGLDLLFDLEKTFFLAYDEERERLHGQTIRERDRRLKVDELIIPMKLADSLPVKCIVSNDLTTSFDRPDNGPVTVDSQLIRLTEKQGILCLPLNAHGSHMGVIIAGLDKNQFTHLSNFLNPLKMLISQTAVALYAEKAKEVRLRDATSERLAVASHIARKISNDLTHPVNIIRENLDALEGISHEEGIEPKREAMQKALDRISGIVENLKALTDDAIIKRGALYPTDLNAFLSRIIKRVKNILSEDVEIATTLELDLSLPTVEINREALKEIMVILLKNAVEGIKGLKKRGRLHIRTKFFPGIPTIQLSENHQHNGYVEISVKDDGPGVAEDIRDRIFDPFFTTKGRPHAGLGLSIAHNIANALGGTITFESQKDKGSTFKLLLPVETVKP